MNHGPYRLAPTFLYLEVSQDDWFRKNATQKEACVKKFRSARFSNSHNSNTASSSSTATPTQNPCQKSFGLLNAGITSVDPTILQHMSEKVERLLNKENAIVQAPGSVDNSAFMFESDTSIRPHYVTIAKNGKVCCSDCPSWKARNLCAHSLAAAEKLGMTAKFIKWFKTNGLKQINLTALVTCDSAKGVGKKGKKATAVRKGGRNAGKTPPTVVVDRISFRAEPHPQNALASPSMPAMFEAQHSSNQVPVPRYYCQLPNSAQPRLSHPSQVSTYPPIPPATEFYATPPPGAIGDLPGTIPFYQPSVSINPASSDPEGFTISLLQFCHSSFRVCFGCSQSLKPGGNIPDPPHDLTITSKMERTFCDPSTGEVRSRRGNVYFHLNLDCVRRKQPYFIAQMAKVPSNVFQHLRPEHLHLLRSLGYCT